jgi:translation initiation factor IF-3
VRVKIRRNGDLLGLPSVRVITASGEVLGVMKPTEALRLAVEQRLDLVEVNPKATPPVCKLLDFSKYEHGNRG